MLAFAAIVLFAQTTISVGVGPRPKNDSTKAAREDSMQFRREQRRDSLRARRRSQDSTEIRRRLAKKVPLTPALLASAFRDPGARNLLSEARIARFDQDTALRGYDATAYERLSVGMGFKRIGRDRLLMRNESAARVIWSRGSPAFIQLLGRRMVMPMLEGAGDAEMSNDMVPIPYYPGREALWIGSGLAKADVSESDIIHPLANGAEAYYTYATGDSVNFQLPGGLTIRLRELVVRPREPKWNVVVASLWFDIASARLVRAVYRLAEPMDIWAVADENQEEDDDKPPRWVKGLISPLSGKLNAVTVEYGLHEGRFWLPRLRLAEGSAQVSFMHVPFKLEESFKYNSVNGTDSLPPIKLAAVSPQPATTGTPAGTTTAPDAGRRLANVA